jgi:hypothetical protein
MESPFGLKDIEVIKSGAFGSGAAASASVAEHLRLSTESLRNERLLEEERKRQLIREADERAAAARRQAERDREIEARMPEFLQRVADITNAEGITSAQKLVDIGRLQQNPDNVNVITQPQVSKFIDITTSSLQKDIDASSEGAKKDDERNKAVAERRFAAGNRKAAIKAAKNIQDPVARQQVLTKIATQKQAEKEATITARTTAKKKIFDEAVKDADASFTKLLDFTIPKPVVDTEADSTADPAKTEGEEKANSVVASFNLAESNLMALLGPRETNKLFKGVDPTDPAALKKLVRQGRRKVANLSSEVAKRPNTLRNWTAQKGVNRPENTKPAQAGSGSGGGFE